MSGAAADSEIEQEARLLSQLRHPHLVEFCGIAKSKHYLYIVTEYCPHSLDIFVPRKALELSSGLAQRVAYEIAIAMAYGERRVREEGRKGRQEEEEEAKRSPMF